MSVDQVTPNTSRSPERVQQASKRMAEVLTRSASDAEFRQQLLTDPRAAMSAHFGKEIPEPFQIRFIESQGIPTIVLPEVATGELSEADLEAVSGGVILEVIAAGSALYLLCDKFLW